MKFPIVIVWETLQIQKGKFPNIIASEISQTIFTLYLMGIICITNTCYTMGKGLPFSIVTNGMR